MQDEYKYTLSYIIYRILFVISYTNNFTQKDNECCSLVKQGCKSREGEDLQDGRGVRCGDNLPPHRYIKNTSTCGRTPTENLLNPGRRPQTSQKARKSPGTWTPSGDLHIEVEPYTKLNPRSCVNKEEKGKFLWTPSGAAD